ncbi:MAG: lysophospholipid acyltransferase family protein [Azoarcus sp.]|nr:lysophospholipid acyltransferase family protein [Azoarcus sp.]
MFVDFFFRSLSRLPLSCLHCLGGWAGWLVWLFSSRYRRHLRANLTQALGRCDPAILREAIAQAGRASFELPWLWLRPTEEVLARIVAVEGWEVVEAARRENMGVLCVTPHLGCFEIAAQHYAETAPITVLYRPPRHAALAPLMQAARTRGQMSAAPANVSGVRQLVRTLRAHGAVGMLPDQVPGEGEGVWADFFGRPAWTMTLAARLAEIRNVQVIYVWAKRLPRGQGYVVHYLEPTLTLEGSLDERCALINREIERLIRLCPGQYLWAYNRYKQPRGVHAKTAEAGATQA